MSLQPLLDAPWVIQAHAFGAMVAFILGAIQLVAPKGTLPHKTLGVIWLLLMGEIAVSSIFVRPSLFSDLPITQWFSWIHIFTVITFYAIVQGTFLLLRGGPTLKYHSRPFIGMFVGGLVVAGALAFLPGRIMHQVAFGG